MVEIVGSWIIQFISTLGYGGIFLLMTLESACIPIPSEVTMPFSGSLAAAGRFSFWVVIICGTVGNLVGSLLAYFLGILGQEAIIRKIIVKYGKYLLISEHEYDRSERWFRKHGEIIVLVSRILPIVRTFISLPAGVAKMNLTRFIIYTTAGSLIWSYILTVIGVILGNNWMTLQVYFHQFDLVIVIIFALGIFWYMRRKLKHFRHEKSL